MNKLIRIGSFLVFLILGVFQSHAQCPTASVTLGGFTSIGATTVSFTWTQGVDSDATLVALSEGVVAVSTPFDGVGYSPSTVFGSGSDLGGGHFVVGSGPETSLTITNLTPGVTYFLSFYSYNQGTLCYNTTNFTQKNFTTNSAGVGIVYGGDGQPSISSNQIIPSGVIGFTFSIGANGGPDIRFNNLTIKAGAGNQVSDWSTVIAGVELFDSQGGSPGDYSDYVIGAQSITFNNIIEGTINSLGRVGNIDVNYFLYIWLKSPMAFGVDNQSLVFTIDDASFVYTSGGTLIPGSTVSSNELGNQNIIDVAASKWVFVTNPPTIAETYAPISPQPIVQAQDDNGNIDLDVTGSVTITNIGGLGMVNDPTSSTNGEVIFSNFYYTTAGVGTLEITSGPIFGTSTGVAVNDNISPFIDPDVMTLNNNGASPETIVFTLNEELNIPEGGSVVGFTSSNGTIFSAIYSGKGTTNTITLTSGNDGDWNISTKISYAGGNVLDLSLNLMTAFLDHAVVGTAYPEITSVSIPNAGAKIGDIVTALINVKPSGSEIFSLTSGDISGYPLTNLVKVSNTQYAAEFTITEGGQDVAAWSNVQVNNLVLSNSLSEKNTPYTQEIVQNNDPIDANRPFVVNITANPVTITDSNVGTGTFSLFIEFNEAMVFDGTANPAITFPVEVPTATIFYNAGQSGWTSSSQFKAVYDVVDANEVIPLVDISIAAVKDSLGNAFNGSAFPDIFSIDMGCPLITIVASTVTDNTSCVAFNGGASIQVNGSSDPTGYTVKWYEGIDNTGILIPAATGFDLTGVSFGNYFVEVKDGAGCIGSTIITINDFITLPISSATITNNTSCNPSLPNGILDINVTGNVGATYTYDITGPGSPIQRVNATQTEIFTGLSEGSYSIVVTDEISGCVSTPVSVSILLQPSVIDASAVSVVHNTFCLSGNGSITVEGLKDNIAVNPAEFSYEWFEGNITTPYTGAVSGLYGETISGLVAGTYFVVPTYLPTECQGTALRIDILDNTVMPVIATTPVSNTSCISPNGSASITIDGTASATGYTINWYLGTVGGTVVANNTITATGLAADNYVVEVIDNITGCSSNNSFVITDNIVLPTATLNGATSICGGETAVLSVVINGGTGPFKIELDNGVGVISNYNSGDPINVTPGSTTTYSVLSVVDANGCSPASLASTATVTVTPIPAAASNIAFTNATATSVGISWTAGTGSGRIVVMKAATAVSANPVNGTNYTASTVFGSGQDLGGGNFVVFNGTTNTVTVTGLTAGTTYYVAVYEYNSGYCYATTAALGNIPIVDCSVPPNVIPTPSSESICSGGTTSISLSSNDSQATFSWTVSATGVSGATNGSGISIAQTLSLTSGSQGTVTYTITPDNGTCTGTSVDVIVVVLANPSLFNVTGGGVICSGGNPLSIGLDGSESGVNYTLYNGTNVLETKPGTGAALTFTSRSVAGTYTVVADNGGGCGTVNMSGSAVITVETAPVLTGAITGNTTVCQGATGINYSITDPGNVTFNWVVPADYNIVAGQGTAQITIDFGAAASGGTIQLTASNNCGTSTPVSSTITVNPGFDASIVTDVDIYATQSANFSVSTTATLSSTTWDFGDGGTSSGQTTTYSYPNTGGYTVSADLVTAEGCTKTIQAAVTVLEPVKIIIKNVVTPNGDGSNDVLWVENLDLYPENEVKFLDRWGVEVAEFVNYANDWDMTNNGDLIPSGSYICIVRLADGDVYSMTVTVIR